MPESPPHPALAEPGSEAWVATQVRRFQAPLLRYATRIVGSRERAFDVVQETFLRLCKQDAQPIADHVAEWLYRVCRHRAIDVLRKERRMHTYETRSLEATETAHEPRPATQPLHALEAQERGHALATCLRELPPRDQELLHLKFHAGFRYRQMSQVTGLSEGNIGYLLHMALRKLRKALESAEATAQRGERTPA